MFVDSHCHLNYPDFAQDQEEVINRARQAGVSTFLTINTRLSESLEIQRIAEQHNDVFCTVGIHPHDAEKHDLEQVYTELHAHTHHPKVVAIGETGLDYYYDHSPRACQIDSFKINLRVAAETDLPVVVHTREADADTLTCLDAFSGVKGVFHCFSGSQALAKAALDRGFYVSFSGIITFKKAQDLRDIVSYVPLDRILIETDSPFLAPIPYRGKRNEPAFVIHVAETVATLTHKTIDEIAHITTSNFFSLFSKTKRAAHTTTEPAPRCIGSKKP